MNRSAVRVYARSLYSVARKGGIVKDVLKDLGVLRRVFAAHPEHVKALQNPFIPLEQRVAVLDRVTSRAHPLLRSFLNYLLRKYALSLLSDIHEAVVNLDIEAEGGMVATLFVAREPGKGELRSIEESVRQHTRRAPRFHVVVDPDMIGGFMMKSESYLIDATMKGLLKKYARGGTHGA